ncbi:TPA: ATP-binding protein [Vibrio vulnificus]|uniref:ATP-binding protein n=2 Tax=Vibrio vulnificus TaxID=672 RepID=UPI002892B9BA|nr:ATP-binding protein [Vibrio vulnificus]WNJ69343.1 ATP-binding protein [Vibrio vulnificus]
MAKKMFFLYFCSLVSFFSVGSDFVGPNNRYVENDFFLDFGEINRYRVKYLISELINEKLSSIDMQSSSRDNNGIGKGKVVIKYTISEKLFPLSYVNDNGEFVGIIHELMEELSLRSDFYFYYIKPNGRSIIKMLEEGVVDILPAQNDISLSKEKFSSSIKYLDVYFDIFENVGRNENSYIAVLTDIDNDSFFLNLYYPQENVKIYSTLDGILSDLKLGNISHILINKDWMYQNLSTRSLSALKELESKLFNSTFKVSVGMVVRKDSESILKSIQILLSGFTDKEISILKSTYENIKLNFSNRKGDFLIYALLLLFFVLLFVIFLSFKADDLKNSLNKSEKVVKLSQDQINWLRKLLNTIPSMISIVDAKGRIVLSNQAYQDAFRQCQSNGCAINGISACTFLSSSASERTEFEKIIQVPPRSCKLGGKFYYVTRKAIMHEEMEMTHYLILFNDISELKNTELALRESNRAAVQAVEARNQFLAVVSHELRTPIAAMLGLMEILSHRLSNSESQQLLDNAIRSAERLSLHVNDILDFSKIEASQLQLDIQEYRIIEELGPVLRSFEASAQLKGLQFNVYWQPTAYIDAKYDALRVNQIVSNLLSNAVKFTEVGQIKVAIACDENALSIEIVDTGCGMTEAQLDCVFQPFVQADTSITRRFGGTGLGMSIVKSLLDLMGGTIAFHSELEQGTKVSVWVPVKGRAYASEIEVAHYLGASDVAMAWFEKWGTKGNAVHGLPKFVDWSLSPMDNLYPDLLLKQWLAQESDNVRLPNEQVTCQLQGRVLIVDDEPINRLLMRKQLKEIGITSVALADGEQAFRYLQQHGEGIDLLITDCHMPIMDGFELTAKTRSDILSFAAKPIVGCTAEDSRIAAEKAMSAGMDKVIYKPYSLAQLQRVLAHYLPEQVQQADTNANWLKEYQEEEREEMANVVIESFRFDIEQLEQEGADIAAIAHRVKGAAGALLLHELAALAKRVEQQKEPEYVERNKQQLILSMQTVVEQANAWLANSKGEVTDENTDC